MRRIFRSTARRSVRAILVLLLCWMLLSMIGCSRYVVVSGDELVSVKKGDLEQLHSDNEQLIQALTECRKGR